MSDREVMVRHPLSEIREWDEALAVLGIQDSDQTPADAIRELNAEIERLRIQVMTLEAALREIARGEGRYSLDQYEHACNTIEDLITIARAALAPEQDR